MRYWCARLYGIPQWAVSAKVLAFWERRRGRYAQPRMRKRYRELLARITVACLACLLLSGCAPMIPVLAGASAAAGFTATAYMPDSINNQPKK